jgi:hypothetical protein
MTSDKLWCDSRVVPSCVTYHLKADAGVMLPTLYLWDGRRRLGESDVDGGVDRSTTVAGTPVAVPAVTPVDIDTFGARASGNGRQRSGGHGPGAPSR